MRGSWWGSRAVVGALGVVAAVTMAVTGCGGDDGGGGGEGGGSTRGQTITYWASNQGATIDQDKEILGKAIDRFTKKTGINVELKVIPWSDLFNNITTAVTSGQGPDVLNIGNTWSATLQSTGAFLPFEGDTANTIGGTDKFLETSMAASGKEGEPPTSVPIYGLSYGLFYNTKLFKEAGITAPPKTWSEFIDTAKKLTKDTDGDGEIDQWGVAVEGSSITENAHWAFILGRQGGGQLFEGSEPTFDTPPIVKGVTEYANLVGSHKVASPSNAQYADGTQALAQFSKGKAAMVMWQNNAENNIKSNGMKPNEYAVAEVPLLDGTDTPVMTHVAGINISVFQESEKKDAALEFVKFLTSPEEQVKLNSAFGSLPVVKAAQDDEAFATSSLKTFNGILAEHAEPMPLINEEGQMETIIGDAVKQLIATAATKGSVSEAEAKAALTEADQKMAAASGGG
jgi:multiple sugar transport system substrate-binding protein